MNNRLPSTPEMTASHQQDARTPSTLYLFNRELLKLVIMSTGIGSALFPLDVLLQKRQTQQSGINNTSTPKNSQTIFSGAKSLSRSFGASLVFSFYKNFAITQRGRVDNTLFGEKPETKIEKLNSPSHLTRALVVASLVGFIDTSLTQKVSNKKTWHAHKAFMKNINKEFTIPHPKTLLEHTRAFKSGYGIRLGKSMGAVGGLLAVPYLKSQIDSVIPQNKYLDISAILASIASGSGVNLILNAADVIGKNQVIQISPHDFRTPSAFNVTKNLIAENGIKALGRGYGIATSRMVMAYYAVSKMETVAEQIIPKIEATTQKALPKIKAMTQSMGLFSNRNVPTKNQESAPNKEKDQDAHSSITAPRS